MADTTDLELAEFAENPEPAALERGQNPQPVPPTQTPLPPAGAAPTRHRAATVPFPRAATLPTRVARGLMVMAGMIVVILVLTRLGGWLTASNGTAKLVTNSIGMQLVGIEPGEFLMGSPESDVGAGSAEKPQHRVRITKAFSLGIYEVTQGQYQAVMGETPSSFKGSDDLPVENVSWLDAIKFCNKLSEREKRVPHYRIDGTEVAVAGGN